MSIGKFVRTVVLENPSMKNEEILALVKKEFPDAKTTYACIAWYKSDMRKKNMIPARVSKSPEEVQAEIDAMNKRIEMLTKQLQEKVAA